MRKGRGNLWSRSTVARPEPEREANKKVARCIFCQLASNHEQATKVRGALVDGGANGGVAGADTRVMQASGRHVDITGIDNHKIKNVRIGSCGSVVNTQRGEVIVVLHEHAILGKGQTMHSSGQMEHHRNLVHDKSMKVGGLQCIITVGEHVIPLQITNGLPYMKMRPHADEEWERLPKTELTSENEWKPAFGVKCFVHDIVCSSDISLLDKMTCLNFREITPKKSNGLGSTAHFFMLS